MMERKIIAVLLLKTKDELGKKENEDKRLSGESLIVRDSFFADGNFFCLILIPPLLLPSLAS